MNGNDINSDEQYTRINVRYYYWSLWVIIDVIRILRQFINPGYIGGFEQFPFRRLNFMTLYQLEYMSNITQLIRQ